MTWQCHACTYINLNDRADRCHACRTARARGATVAARAAAPSSSAPPPAIVDLTDVCSPDPDGGRTGRGGPRDGTMESHRRRRRRRERGGGERRSRNNADERGCGERAAADDGGNENFNSDDGAARPTESAFAGSVAPRSWKESGKRNADEMDKGDGDRDRKREGEDEHDVLADPAPRRKLHLLEQSSFEPGKHRESKLKKRRTVVDGAKRSVSNDAKQLPYPDKLGPSVEFALSCENSHNRRPTAPSNESKTGRQHSSNKDGRGGRASKNRPGPSLANYFIDPRKQPPASAEELLERAKAVLRQTFKHDSLRPLQETAVKGALRKKSQIVIMATGVRNIV